MIGIALEVVLRVAAMSIVLCALGLGPATWLKRDLPTLTRLVLVPVLGLAVSLGLLTTANWLMPGRVFCWVVLLPAIVVSLVIAWKRGGLKPMKLRRREIAMVVVVAATVVAIFTVPMALQRSLGPVGYQVYDSGAYIALIGGLERHPLRQRTWGPDWDITARAGEHSGSHAVQQVGFDSVAASVNPLFGFAAWSSQSSFMIVLILIGALGLMGAVAALVPDWRPAWMLAGLLYAGPLTYQLWLDGSEAALAGLALLGPAALFGSRLLARCPSRSDVVFFGLFLAAFHTAYPLLFPTVVLAAIAVGVPWFVVNLARLRKAADDDRRTFVRRTVLGVAAIAVCAIAFSPWAFERNLHYWYLTLTSNGFFATLPQWDLPLPVIPSYLLQTHEFYYLPHISDISVREWLLTDVIPLGMIAVAVLAVVRVPRSIVFASVSVVAAGLAWYASKRDNCSYCVQRSLLVDGPMLAALLAVGIAAVAALPVRYAKAAAYAGIVGLLVVVGHTDSVSIRRAAQGAYMTPLDLPRSLGKLGDRPGPVMVEGFWSTMDAPIELPAALHMTRQTGSQRISYSAENDDNRGLAYLGGPRPAGPEYAPDYRLVITRLPSIKTDRRTIAQHGPFALQQRTGSFDVLVTSGVLVDRAKRDPQGHARIVAPLSFWISGPPGAPSALEVVVRGLDPARLTSPASAKVRRAANRDLVVCAPLTQASNPRRMTLKFRKVKPVLGPSGVFGDRPQVLGGPTLKAMRVVDRCQR